MPQFPALRWPLLIPLLCCLLSLGWSLLTWELPPAGGRNFDGRLRVEGIDWRYWGGRLDVRAENGERYQLRLGNARMADFLRAGDRGWLQARGRVWLPDDRGYRTWVHASGYDGILSPWTTDFSQLSGASLRLRWVRWVRDQLQRYPAPERLLLTSLLTGIREYDPQYYRQFSASGTAHLLAISGLHVGFVWTLGFVVLGLAPLGLRGRILLATPLALAYVTLAGAPISAVRAAIFLAFAAVAILVRRRFSPLQALLWTACLCILIWPGSPYSIGFQFSFLIVLCLLLWGQIPQRGNWLRDSLWICILAFLGSLPVTAAHFGAISLVSPLVNLVAIPLFALFVPLAALAVLLPLPEALVSLPHDLLLLTTQFTAMAPIDFDWRASLLLVLGLALFVWRRQLVVGGFCLTAGILGFLQMQPQPVDYENRFMQLQYRPEEGVVRLYHKAYSRANLAYAEQRLLESGITQARRIELSGHLDGDFVSLRGRTLQMDRLALEPESAKE